MTDNTTLKVTNMANELTTVEFHGAQLLAIRGDTLETTMISPKQMSDAMGLSWSTQLAKIKAHPVLSKGIAIFTIPSAGGPQETVMMSLSVVPGWMMTINVSKVAPASRGVVVAYQTEAFAVLFAHFFGQATATVSGSPAIILALAAVQAEIAALHVKQASLEAGQRALLEGFDPAQIIATGYRPMLDIVKAEGASSKSRRALSQSCSAKMRRWCAATGRNGAVRTSRETGRYIFHIDAVTDWLKAEGRAIIVAHKDKMAGQGVLRLITKQT